MDPLKLPLEELLYRRLGLFFDQLNGRKVPDLYKVLMEQLDRAVVRQALERASGQLGAAALFLDLDRNTLARKAKKLKVLGAPQAAPGKGGR
ncbi:MAG TPA: helix-turn-helix domain-containing protein [Myxococcaceae bacterium]|nr:helix-turn-helix domain-containing protein [Myxococcaceae bacterium]